MYLYTLYDIELIGYLLNVYFMLMLLNKVQWLIILDSIIAIVLNVITHLLNKILAK